MRARENPFSTNRLENLNFRPQGTSWEELIARLKELNYRAAIIGPQGSGKTRLLETLAERLAEDGFQTLYLRVSEQNRAHFVKHVAAACPRITHRNVVFVDSSEKLTFLSWARLKLVLRKAGGLVITAHRTGRLPTLIKCETSPELLIELLRELAGEKAGCLRKTAADTFFKHRGDIRLSLLHYYDMAAQT